MKKQKEEAKDKNVKNGTITRFVNALYLEYRRSHDQRLQILGINCI